MFCVNNQWLISWITFILLQISELGNSFSRPQFIWEIWKYFLKLKPWSKSTKLHGNAVLSSRSKHLMIQKWCLKSLIFDHFEVRFGVDPMVRIDSKPKFPLVPTYNYSRFQGIYPTPNSLGDLMLQKFLENDPSNSRNILIWLLAV